MDWLDWNANKYQRVDREPVLMKSASCKFSFLQIDRIECIARWCASILFEIESHAHKFGLNIGIGSGFDAFRLHWGCNVVDCCSTSLNNGSFLRVASGIVFASPLETKGGGAFAELGTIVQCRRRGTFCGDVGVADCHEILPYGKGKQSRQNNGLHLAGCLGIRSKQWV